MEQWLRKAGLIVTAGTDAIDLSQFHFRFKVTQQDFQSPNTADIRVWNLDPLTRQRIVSEFTGVMLQAGYNAPGVIFQGTIKQVRIGKENETDTYLDILAADGDLFHNFATVNMSLAGGSSVTQRVEAVAKATSTPIQFGAPLENVGGVLPRGKVLFGMAKDFLEHFARTTRSTWSISNGTVVFTALDGVDDATAIVLSSATGLIGLAESTQEGVSARCLLNPLLVPGRSVRIDNALINQTLQSASSYRVPFNSYTGLQFFADVAADGFYRVLVAEHTGDTRGQQWYTELVCLTLNSVTQKVVSNG